MRIGVINLYIVIQKNAILYSNINLDLYSENVVGWLVCHQVKTQTFDFHKT